MKKSIQTLRDSLLEGMVIGIKDMMRGCARVLGRMSIKRYVLAQYRLHSSSTLLIKNEPAQHLSALYRYRSHRKGLSDDYAGTQMRDVHFGTLDCESIEECSPTDLHGYKFAGIVE
jgi:hypothetical protein